MNNDQINELLSLMGQQIKEHAELREETTRRFEQLAGVMADGFLRLEDKLGARLDNIAKGINSQAHKSLGRDALSRYHIPDRQDLENDD